MAAENEFDVTAANWLKRAYYTPVSDALRGQLTARLDVRGDIAAANLPLPLARLIYSVCRRTRLWRGEKSDVARELIAHFSDGMSAGRTADELTNDFGPVEQAAQLIRRAKLRNRPLWWRSCRFGIRLFLATLGVFLLVYSVLAARFYLGKPAIEHNYWHEINAARRVDEAERAWPLYREAILKLGKEEFDTEWMDDGPTGKDWNKAVEMLGRHQESLALIRQGAKKPHLGSLIADPADRAAELAVGQDRIFAKQSADDNEWLIEALLPAIQEMRRVAHFLDADAKVAAIGGDGATALADLTALVSLGEQMFQPNAFLVDQFVGIAIFGIATETTGTILRDSPDLFNDAQLRDLAHRIGAFCGGSVPIDFGPEALLADDLLQRAFTDDGHGDGRIAPEGVKLLSDLIEGNMSITYLFRPIKGEGAPAMVAKVIGPGVAALIGSRKENRDAYYSILAEMIAAHQGPPWLWHKADSDFFEAHGIGRPDSSIRRMRYWLPYILLPAIDSVFSAAERTKQVRDGAKVAIALTLWKRRHGQWPERLDQLVPDLLPSVPPDRADGKPLRYAIRDGQAVVYSIGADWDDDGGRRAASPDSAMVIDFGKKPPAAPKTESGEINDDWSENRLEMPSVDSEQVERSDDDGDWILWPPVKVERPPSAE
jgi:hypothetical protein